MDADPSFMIFRKFGWARNFALLELQDELQEIEFDLEMHEQEEYDEGDRKRPRSRRLDTTLEGSRHELIVNLLEKLSEYGKTSRYLRMQEVNPVSLAHIIQMTYCYALVRFKQ